jgi:hypothetical protein
MTIIPAAQKLLLTSTHPNYIENTEKIQKFRLVPKDSTRLILSSNSDCVMRNKLLNDCTFGGLGVDHPFCVAGNSVMRPRAYLANYLVDSVDTLSATNLPSQSASMKSHKGFRIESKPKVLTLTRSGGRRSSFYPIGIVQRPIHGILRLFRHQSALTNQNSQRISVQLLQQSTNTRIREQ